MLRSGFWVSFSSVSVNAITTIRQIALARLLTPEIFGLMSICSIIIRGMQVITELGFGAALIHRQSSFEESKDTAFTMTSIRGVILTLFVALLISPIAAWFYRRSELNILLQVLALTFFIDSLRNINTIALQKELDFKLLTYISQASSVISTCIVITLAWYMRNVWALVIGSIFNSIVNLTMSYVFVPGRPKFMLHKDIVKDLFHYGKFITGLSIVTFFVTELDNIVIGKIIGIPALGYYAIAFTLANLPATHISKVASQILFPLYSKMQHDVKALRKGYSHALSLVSGITIPAAAGLIVLAPEIIGCVYGEKWLPAVIPLQLLAIFGVIRSVVVLIGYLMNGIGQPKTNFKIACVRAIVIVSIIYPLSANLGIVGVALAVNVSIAIQLLLCMIKLRQAIELSLKDQVAILLPWVIYSFAMATLIIAIKQYLIIGIVELPFAIMFGAASYFMLARKRIKNTLSVLKLSKT